MPQLVSHRSMGWSFYNSRGGRGGPEPNAEVTVGTWGRRQHETALVTRCARDRLHVLIRHASSIGDDRGGIAAVRARGEDADEVNARGGHISVSQFGTYEERPRSGTYKERPHRRSRW